jgi:hypothetical protein
VNRLKKKAGLVVIVFLMAVPTFVLRMAPELNYGAMFGIVIFAAPVWYAAAGSFFIVKCNTPMWFAFVCSFIASMASIGVYLDGTTFPELFNLGSVQD